MRKLWLHLGSHKTGTTSIQKTLAATQKAGLLTDLECPLDRGEGKALNLTRSGASGGEFHATVSFDKLKRYLTFEKSLVLSNEALFWIYEPEIVTRFAEILKPRFDEIRVIAYLRRQDQLALSHRKQVVRGRPAERFYGVDVQALPVVAAHFGRFFDYAAKMDMWADAFGRDAMIVRRYDRSHLKDGDAVTDFFDVIGQPFVKLEAERNPPFSRGQILTGLFLKKEGFDQKVINRIVNNMKPDEPIKPSRSDAEAFLAQFADSNRKLAASWGSPGEPDFFSTDTSMYPEVGNDTLEQAGLKPARLLRQARRKKLL